MERLTIALVLSLFFGGMELHAEAHRLGLSLMAGISPSFGNQYLSQNTSVYDLDPGIRGLSSANSQLKIEGIPDPQGLALSLWSRYLYKSSFFIETGMNFTTTLIGGSGDYILRDSEGKTITVNGKAVQGSASFSLYSFQFPLVLGLVISFWEMSMVHLGFGVGYALATEKIQLETKKKSILDFKSYSEAKANFLYYKFVFETSSQISGGGGELPIYLVARLERMIGSSGFIQDRKTKGDNPKTSTTGYVKKDVVMIDLTSWKITIGVSLLLPL